MTKFTEEITFVKVRADGQVMLVGDKMGHIELIELNNRLALRTYDGEHKN